MGEKIREGGQDVSPKPKLYSPERVFLFLCIGLAIAGAITGGLIAYCYAAGRPWSKFWVGGWLCLPAGVVGALGAAVLCRLAVRRSKPSFEALMAWVAPGSFLSGLLAIVFWQLVWSEETAAGPAVDVAVTVFGTLAGAMGGIGLLLIAEVCIIERG